MVAYLAWGAEGLLELTGAVLFFGRRSTAVWLWLGFRFAADLACAILPAHYYQPADYTQRHIQYFFFAAACTYAAWRILREAKSVWWYVGAMCAMVACAVARVHSLWPLTPSSVLTLEISVEMLLAASVAYALGMAKGKAPHPWGTIGAALVIMGGWDGGITLMRQYGYSAEAWYPLGAILGLALLAWAGWGDLQFEQRIARQKAEDFRRPLGEKVETYDLRLWGIQ